MNDLEKRSFYSFLGLYVISSFLFIAIIGYWYYTAQKNALKNETYYRLEHLADHLSGEIIFAHMQGRERVRPDLPKDISVALINTNGKVVKGSVPEGVSYKTGYFRKNGFDILISDAPHEHLNVKYIVVQTDTLDKKIASLRNSVVYTMILTALLIVVIAWILSKLFMRPVHQRVTQIERFINDVTHELNTPISSLSMATDQALKQGECTQKTLKNISISTRQLYDIYRSLTYLNFSNKQEAVEVIELQEVLLKSIEYYTPLAEVKQIAFRVQTEPTTCALPESQATLLLGNLIGNAIKYSSRKTEVEIALKDRVLTIRDEGIGIAPEKLKNVFERFERATEYSGGFGVGLSIVKSICKQYNIRIEVDSVLKEGTEFRLYFP